MEGLLGRFLSFEKLIAPAVIKILYYILIVVLILGAIAALFQGLTNGQLITIITAPVGLIIGLLALRVFAEIYMVIFRISEDLNYLRKTKEKDAGAAFD